jgi:hypothetical protein
MATQPGEGEVALAITFLGWAATGAQWASSSPSRSPGYVVMPAPVL